MISESHLELVRTKGSKFGRVLMGLLFFVSGLSILLSPGGPTATAGYFTSLGVPVAGLLVWVVIALKLVAGGAIMIGKRTTEAAAALIVFTLIATLLAHLDFADPMQMTQALKNLAIVGGLLYLMAFGPHGTNVLGDDPGELTGK
ncbi:MAG: DoxX family protein [Candidatus Pacebacteria bacterium]|nr:DoxX family protein [Candidatus Paceibacterota bacterium]